MAHHQANHPIASVAHAPVMVAGFSQGGITAGAFAQDYSSQYNIQQIVTAGAPIGRFDIPSSVHVLSYESTADPVPRLDGTNNPTGSNWQTVHADDGGTGPGGSHSDLLYAKMAANNPPDAAQQTNLNQFLSGNGHITDYYASK
jgi:poly(3-hydroxybutyrate) depolymerase